jgi:2,4-dienoyl-CoA reductase-like NADH-dependent reductase (Old Yellow Enzyme family)
MRLRNRLVYLPVATGYATRDGFVTGGLVNYLAARAVHVGMTIVEGTVVRQGASLLPNQVSAYDDKFIPGLAKLANAIETKGSAAVLQIVDYGARTGTCGGTGDPLAPSRMPAGVVGLYESIEMTGSQIMELVNAFAEAARRAYDAKFDAVEIHAAHMYLINQFLSGFTNWRIDEYGGSVENRARFLLNIVAAIKARVPSSYPLVVRINGEEPFNNGLTIEEAEKIAQLLEKAGCDIISVSRISRKHELKVKTGETFQWMTAVPPKEAEEGCNALLADAIRKVVHIPVIAAGKIRTLELAEKILSEEKADLIGMARQLIADPDMPIKELEGRTREIRRCKEDFLCQTSLGSGKPMRCAVNKALPPENISTPI